MLIFWIFVSRFKSAMQRRHCTITRKINGTHNGVYLPISKLHSILAVANLRAHNNISQICYCGQLSLQIAAVNCSFSDNLHLWGYHSFCWSWYLPYECYTQQVKKGYVDYNIPVIFSVDFLNQTICDFHNAVVRFTADQKTESQKDCKIKLVYTEHEMHTKRMPISQASRKDRMIFKDGSLFLEEKEQKN